MALACGLAIANLFYNQPLLAQIGRGLHATVRQVGLLPALTQAGFAVGVFLIAPLGDILERRRLILTMLGLVTLTLVGAAIAPNLAVLAVASLLMGVTSVISTLVLPFAVQLARPNERGATVGSMAAAMLIGILLSRTLSGLIGGVLGWRFMYAVAAIFMVALALVLRRLLPTSRPALTMPYGALLRSMIGLFRSEPLLRSATYNGMLVYAALSAFWATLIFFVEGRSYHYGPAAAGMFGLVAALGASATPLVGRLADRLSPRTIVGIASGVMLAGFALLWAYGTCLTGLIAGVILIDVAAQTATVSNQATVYSLAPNAHSRVYTIYRTAYSVGGSAGALAGAWGWSVRGWPGVCAMSSTCITFALFLHLWAWRTARGTGVPKG